MQKAVDILRKFKEQVDAVLPTAKIYLFGENLRNVLMDQKVTMFDVFVETKELEKFDNQIRPGLIYFKNLQVFTGKKISFENQLFTTSCLYIDVEDILNKTKDCIQSVNGGYKDYLKRILRLTDTAKENFENNPSCVFDIINTLDTTNFYIDPNIVTFIFANKHHLNKIEKRKIFIFLKNILKRNKPRKCVANLNTLGIANELFGVNLVQSAVLNHLRTNDVYEFLALIFENIDVENMESFLVQHVGVLVRDANPIVEVSKLLNNINPNNDVFAKYIVDKFEKPRLPCIARMFNALGYKELSKSIRRFKEFKSDDKLCLNAGVIKIAFGIQNENIVNKLLELAECKIKSDPNFNTKSKLLVYLQQERELLC